jgi:hypothetical protein
MSGWSLERVLAGLHHDVQTKLDRARSTFAHPGTKGDASEGIWIDLLNEYLPARYRAAKCHVADSLDQFSDQIDVAIYDRQYSPLIAAFQGQNVIPAEAVYAVFEAKQSANAAHVGYAKAKAESVRCLRRTSLPIPTASGVIPAREPPPIIAGLLTFESDWSPPLGESLIAALAESDPNRALDIGCIAAHGTFWTGADGYEVRAGGKAATAFLLELIARLQASATVPMLDVRAYAHWLGEG